MRLFRHPWIWIARFRKRKGYGVHSPWAFSFITNVIYEKTPFYAYKDLDHYHPRWVKWGRFYPLQCRRLLFRIANYVHPEAITCLGECEMEEKYIRAAVKAPISGKEGGHLLFSKSSHLSRVPYYIDNIFASSSSAQHCIILEGIHKNKANLSLWKQLQADTRTGTSFDLFTYGIILFDHPRHKQHYKVNF